MAQHDKTARVKSTCQAVNKRGGNLIPSPTPTAPHQNLSPQHRSAPEDRLQEPGRCYSRRACPSVANGMEVPSGDACAGWAEVGLGLLTMSSD